MRELNFDLANSQVYVLLDDQALLINKIYIGFFLYMNIFASFNCPYRSSEFLDDKRVIKMVLESAQLLSTALHINGIEGIYRKTHVKHPCTIWTARSRSNYEWLLEHFKALYTRYSMIYDREHACSRFFGELARLRLDMPDVGLTEFANCAANKELNIDFKSIDDVHLAYRMYLNERWKHDKRVPTWCGSLVNNVCEN